MPTPVKPTLRASVTADAIGLTPGDPAPILVDGADTPITANGLANYTPLPGDRLLVQQVGGTVEVMQFISTGSVPYTETFRQDAAPDPTTTPLGAIWYDTSTGANNPYRLEADPITGVPTWVSLAINAGGLDVPNVRASTVESGFNMGGGGIGSLSSGATSPTLAPTIENYYPTLNSPFYQGGGFRDAFFAGLETYHADATKWVTAAHTDIIGGPGGTDIMVLNKSDLAQSGTAPTSGQTWRNLFSSEGGIARVGSTYYLLGTDSGRNGIPWYLYQIDGTTWNKTRELRIGDNNVFHLPYRNPRLVSNGTNVGFIWSDNSGHLNLRWFNSSLVQVGSDIVLRSNQSDIWAVGDAVWGDAGTGLGASTLHVALATSGGSANVLVWSGVTTTGATRQSGYDWKRPNGASVNAMGLDTTTGHFRLIDQTGASTETSQIATTNGSKSVTARYTFYDGDTGTYPGAPGSGTTIVNGTDVSGTASTTHETGYSPTATFTTDRRAWVRIISPIHAPDETNLDTTKVDRANKIGFYAAIGGGTMFRVGYGTVGQVAMDGFDTFPVSGTPAANTFATAQVSLGVFESAGVRLDGLPRFYVDGAGTTSNMDGLIPPGTILMFASATIPPGWYACDGASKTTAAEPDLFAACGYKFGGSGANFNLPDMRGRYPFGSGGTAGSANKVTIGDYEGGASGTAAAQADTGRLDHSHSHTVSLPQADLNVTSASNTPTSGAANRVVSLSGLTVGNHSHSGGSTDAKGVNGANQSYHGTMVLQFIIKR
jgi:microcystin-dependent protein